MHVNLETMQHRLARAFILLALTLVMRNSQCFAQCLTQPADSQTTHCHQHGQAKSSHCVVQHDASVDSPRAAAPVDGVPVVLVIPAAVAVRLLALHAVSLFAESPPAILSDGLILPLRV